MREHSLRAVCYLAPGLLISGLLIIDAASGAFSTRGVTNML